MIERLTNDGLAAIRERAEKATEGKWSSEIWCHERREYVVGSFNGDVTIVGDNVSENDAAFIAHARQDIPKLLAEIERLKIVIAETCEGIGAVRGKTSYGYEHVTLKADDILKVRRRLMEEIANE